MVVDLDRYTVNKRDIHLYYERNKDRTKVRDMVSILSAPPPFVPCIVVAFYLGEVSGWPPEILECIQNLAKYYHILEIKNKPPGYPGPGQP
jgi:hypothetical protein